MIGKKIPNNLYIIKTINLQYDYETYLYLFNLRNNSHLISEIDHVYYTHTNLLRFVIMNKEIIKIMLKRDNLLIYSFIDFFKKHNNIINKKKNDINNFITNKNFNFLNSVWNYLNTKFDEKNFFNPLNSELTYLNREVTAEKNNIFYYILNKTWRNSIYFKNDSIINIEALSKQLIICYYHNKFNDLNLNNCIIEDEDYDEYAKLIIHFSDVYTKIDNKLVFKEINQVSNSSITVNLDDTTMIEIEYQKNLLLSFINFCVQRNIVNKNLISWFYIIFMKNIPDHLHNYFFYIILGYNKNILGYISKILLCIGLDYHELNKKHLDDFLKNFHTSGYIYKVGEHFESEINEYVPAIINNIELKEKLNNIMSNEKYWFLQIKDLEKICTKSFFFLFIISPLDISWDACKYDITNITHKLENIDYYCPDYELYKIYNSVIISKFTIGNYILFRNDNDIINVNIENSNIYHDIFFENIFNEDILKKNLLMYFSSNEIFPKIKKELKNDLPIYDNLLEEIIELYLNIFPQEKETIIKYRAKY